MKQKNTPNKASRPDAGLTTMVSVIALLFPLMAQADEQIEEIMVTAQKRAQSLQDVGITMSALTGDDLKNLNVSEVQSVAANVPNVQVNYGFGQNAFNIRGMGMNEFAANLDSPVAVHLDEVYISKNFMTTLMLFDIDRVEALKGPQGTLFGRNTTGGSINFFTKRPTDELHAGTTIGYGNYNTFRGEAFVSGPLADKLSGRLSAFVEDQGKGFYHNLTRGDTEGRSKKFALRAQLAWHNEATHILGSFHYGKDKSEMPPYEGVGVFTPASLAAGQPAFCAEYLNGTVNGGTANCVRGIDGINPGDNNPYTSNGNLLHKADNTSTGGMLRIEHDLESATLTAITGYEHFDRAQQEDSDGSPYRTIEVYWNQKINQFTQEVRLTSTGDGIWNYVLGGFYEHDSLKNGDYLSVAAGAAPGYFTSYGQKVDAASLFFHNSVRVADHLSLVAGTRYTWEKTKIDGGTSAGVGLASVGGVMQPTTILVDLATSGAIPSGNSRKDEDVSFKVGVEWKPQISNDKLDNLLLYANVSTGFRSGGYNAAFAGSQDAFTSLSPERITAYEAGFKATLAKRSLQLDGAIFRYDFKDGFVNVDSSTAPVPITINAANIKTLGAEFDLHWRPVEGLDLKAGVGLLDAKIKSNISSGGISLLNFSPVNSPKWTFNGQARYEIPVTSDWRFAVSGDVSGRGKQYLETVNAPSNLEHTYWIVNARATLFSVNDHWSVAVWGKNLTKTVYRSYVNDLPTFGWLLNIYGSPRTYGITTSVNF